MQNIHCSSAAFHNVAHKPLQTASATQLSTHDHAWLAPTHTEYWVCKHVHTACQHTTERHTGSGWPQGQVTWRVGQGKRLHIRGQCPSTADAARVSYQTNTLS
jgi:hypothetical protein